MANITINSEKREGAVPPPTAALPNPQHGNVYVLQVPSYSSMHNKVIAVFKNATSLERFFKGARLAQLRYQGHDATIEQVRSWYTVTERKVEG